jgi:hypothetical protein
MKIKIDDSELPEADAPKNPLRRRQCRDNFLHFCLTYFGDSKFARNDYENCFYDPTDAHVEYCSDLQKAILSPSRTKMARAYPRGFGKTTVAILATIWAVLYGHKRYPIWFCVNEAKAKERADLMMNQLLSNRLLADDFPEVCAPLRVEGPSDWVSGGKKLANNAFTLWRSIDGGNLGTIPRPDFIVTDDPEDVSTIRKTGNNLQSITAQKRFERIDKEMGFLPDQGKGAFLMITTIRSRGCLSDEFTDPECKKAWNGKVFSAIDFGDTDFWDFEHSSDDMPRNRFSRWAKFLAICGSKDCGKKPDDSELSTPEIAIKECNVSELVFNSYHADQQLAMRYFAANKAAMMEGIKELDPVRIPAWDFFWQVGSDARGREIVWSELQNRPFADPFTKMMLFSEKKLWEHQIKVPMGDLNGYKNILCAIVVGTNAIHYEVKSCSDDYSRKHLVECGSILPDPTKDRESALQSALDNLRSVWSNFTPKRIAVDIGTEAGRDRGEWSEVVARYCAMNRPWLALQKCSEWDAAQSSRAGFKNWCVESTQNPYRILRWNATHFKNRLAAAYNNPEHPITFFDPGSDSATLWKYIRSQTSEQYTLEFIPDKDATKANVEKWVPIPKFRNMTEFWKTASMIECLADIEICCKQKIRPVQLVAKQAIRLEKMPRY